MGRYARRQREPQATDIKTQNAALNRLARAAKACPKYDTCAENGLRTAISLALMSLTPEMRLDRASLIPGDDRGIDAHCLDLLASSAILIGAYVKGVMRASAEIVPDRTARRAEAVDR